MAHHLPRIQWSVLSRLDLLSKIKTLKAIGASRGNRRKRYSIYRIAKFIRHPYSTMHYTLYHVGLSELRYMQHSLKER